MTKCKNIVSTEIYISSYVDGKFVNNKVSTFSKCDKDADEGGMFCAACKSRLVRQYKKPGELSFGKPTTYEERIDLLYKDVATSISTINAVIASNEAYNNDLIKRIGKNIQSPESKELRKMIEELSSIKGQWEKSIEYDKKQKEKLEAEIADINKKREQLLDSTEMHISEMLKDKNLNTGDKLKVMSLLVELKRIDKMSELSQSCSHGHCCCKNNEND